MTLRRRCALWLGAQLRSFATTLDFRTAPLYSPNAFPRLDMTEAERDAFIADIQGSPEITALHEALDDLWGCISASDAKDLQPETIGIAKANHELIWHSDGF